MNDIYPIILSFTSLSQHFNLIQTCRDFKNIIVSFYVPIYEVLLKAFLNDNFSDRNYVSDSLYYNIHRFNRYNNDPLLMCIENNNYIIARYLIEKVKIPLSEKFLPVGSNNINLIKQIKIYIFKRAKFSRNY